MSTTRKTRVLVECALMVALAVVLNFIKFAPWPQGGSITLAAMAPLVFLSLRHGWKWGLLSSFVYSLTQMLLDGLSAPPVNNFLYYALVVLLDYVIAYTVLGLAPVFAKPLMAKRPLLAVCVGSVCVTLLRYLCHIVSGLVIWGVYVPGGVAPIVYSVTYNGSYMIPETISTALVVVLLWKFVTPRIQAPQKA